MSTGGSSGGGPGDVSGRAARRRRLYLDVQAMRWAVLDAAGHADSGRPFGLVASMAKVVCSEGALRVTAWAHQVHGGEGFYADRDPALFYRRARALAPRLGDVRWHLARIDALRRDPANG